MTGLNFHPMPAVSPKLPQRIGSYQILRLIATGGMGQVLLAHDEGLDRPVAIKRLRPDARISEERRQRFRREARLAAGLDHPAIVRVYDLLHDDGVECIVMEYVEGSTVRKLVKSGPIPIRFVLEIGMSISGALALAHENGIVHRDLKSENILIMPTGQPKVTDFGIAKQLLTDEGSLTKSAVLLGTCRAMAPEQALAKEVDHRSDLFSFGILLYEMLAAQSPFEDKNDLVTLQRITTKPHPPLRDFCPKAPKALCTLVDELLAKSPADRPQAAQDVISRLSAIAIQAEEDDPTGSKGFSGLGAKIRRLSQKIRG